MASVDFEKILDSILDERVLELVQAMIRIPSASFQEQDLADYLANYMSEIGLEVEMMDVPNRAEPGTKSRQPIGRLQGTGGGPSLMLNGHMDPGVEMTGWSADPYGGLYDEDGWVWGMGAHDDKGGIAAAICGIEAIIKSGAQLKGDVVVCPVVAHKKGGVGSRALIEQGVLTDFCLNMEHSANTIATVCVGLVLVKIKTRSPELFFRYSDEARADYLNPIEQQCEVVRRLGPSLTPLIEKDWMRFKPHPDLPNFPKLTYDSIHREHYFHKNYTGMSTRECDMSFQIRTVPGQTLENITEDIRRVLDGIRADHPAFDCELFIPAYGPDDFMYWEPMEIAKDSPLVLALAEGHRAATGTEPEIGGALRIGNVGDGNILGAAGVPSLQYGPGDIRIYKEWPTPDERVRLVDLVTAAKSVGYATARLCG
jgi:acetylornithine deacetylase/succinyl-diaminopimelate desuccinylase-like protein